MQNTPSNLTINKQDVAQHSSEDQVDYKLLKNRFRGYLPVVIDVETAGFEAKTDALLEIAAITLTMDEQGNLIPDETMHFHIEPFEGANINPDSLKFTGIDITNPLRGAVDEAHALREIFRMVRRAIKKHSCKRAIVVAHNANFDLSFMMAAAERCEIKRNPFHPFATLDTATLSAFMLGQNVLIKACQLAKIPFDAKQAHSALYDTERTTELFCHLVNKLKDLKGFPLSDV